MARGPVRRATIYDVAERAGVATSTVSRAFANPDRVNAATREHVLAVARELDYVPNPLARALPSCETRTVGLLVSDVTNPHFFGVIRGAERQLHAAGRTLILADTEESAEMEQTHIDRLARSVDGFVLAASRVADRTIRKLAEKRPMALISRQVTGLPSAVVDFTDGSRQIIEHLVSLGHRSVVHLAGPRTSWLAAQRWRMINAAGADNGIAIRRVGPFPPTMPAGAAAADAALASGSTAAIAYNDLLAIGMLRRFAQRGVSVPADISVVGFDDIFGADFCAPPLTTLAGPFEQLGRTGVDLLLGLDGPAGGGRSNRQVVLPSHLVIRGSTGSAPR